MSPNTVARRDTSRLSHAPTAPQVYVDPDAPRARAAALERAPTLPEGDDDRFTGYGLLELPFASGHVISLRRVAASTVGPAYTSVWLRAPDGRRRCFVDGDTGDASVHYEGARHAEMRHGPIRLTWTGDHRLTVEVPAAALHFTLTLADRALTRAFRAACADTRGPIHFSAPALRVLEWMGRHFLTAPRWRLRGRAPGERHVRVHPQALWVVTECHANLAGVDLGDPSPSSRQEQRPESGAPPRALFVFAVWRYTTNAT